MIPYHYTESGLDNIYLLNGVQTIVEDSEQLTSINNLDQLHLQIAKTLIGKHSSLEAKEFKFLRVELNLSQKALAELLGVDSQTVARWEKSETAIPRGSDVLLRAYYLESQSEDSKIALLLKTLAESETNEALARIEFEKHENQWQRKEA